MIKVLFWQKAENELVGYTINGHAGFAPKGEDIVCAAISALAQTAVLALQELLEKEPEVSVEDGGLECMLPGYLEPGDRETARIILKTLEIGINAIAADYKKHVEVKYAVKA